MGFRIREELGALACLWVAEVKAPPHLSDYGQPLILKTISLPLQIIIYLPLAGGSYRDRQLPMKLSLGYP